MSETATLVEEIKFEEFRLNAAIIHESRVPAGDTIIIGDYATSAEPKPSSDFSAFVAGKIVSVDNHSHLFLIDGIMDRWESRELAGQIVGFAKRYPPRYVYLERVALSSSSGTPLMSKRRNTN